MQRAHIKLGAMLLLLALWLTWAPAWAQDAGAAGAAGAGATGVAGVGIADATGAGAAGVAGATGATGASPSPASSASPSPKSLAGDDGVIPESQLVTDSPINSAFYKPQLYYPPENVARSVPKVTARAYFLAFVAVGLFLLFTWPLNDVEFLFVEREVRLRRQGSRSNKLVEGLRQNQILAPAPDLQLVSRSVSADSGADVAPQAHAVPLLSQVRGLDEPAAQDFNALEELAQAAGPAHNPLSAWSLKGVQGGFIWPLSEQEAHPGLYLVQIEGELSAVLREMIIDLLRRTKGKIALALAGLDEADLVYALVGVQNDDNVTRLSVIRRESRHLHRVLQRLRLPRGQRLYFEEFLRGLSDCRHSVQGLSGVILDCSARFEIGAQPRLLDMAAWCQGLQEVAQHCGCPIFVVGSASELPANLPYSRMTLTSDVKAAPAEGASVVGASAEGASVECAPAENASISNRAEEG